MVSSCETGHKISYETWLAEQSTSTIEYTTDKTVTISLNWSRIGPFSRYDTKLRANAFGGMIDVYGAQTCLGKFVRDDRLSPAHGWWELICPDDSYAAGKFRLTEQGSMQGFGTSSNEEKVTFDLPIGD